MAQYRVTKLSFINNALRQEGDTIDYDGLPGDNLEPVDKAAEKAKASVDFKATNEQDKARQKAAAEGNESSDLPGGGKAEVDAPLA